MDPAVVETWAREAWERGLVVYTADGRIVPIPLVVEPCVIDDAAVDRLAEEARGVLEASVRVACAVFSDARYAWLWAGFTELERKALRPQNLMRVTTARIDCFVDRSGDSKVLELNATIPAMQGYSDLATHGWIRAFGRSRGLSTEVIEAAVAANGSNAADLLASLDESWVAAGRSGTPSILIVCRRNDAQQGELDHYVRTWGAGREVARCFADEVTFDDQQRTSLAPEARALGRTWDLVYRHVFARRIDAASPLASALIDGRPFIRNPITSLLEVKGLVAVLHQAALGEAPEADVLDARERELIRRKLPWTRLLAPVPGHDPDGAFVPDLARWTAAHADRLVVKRSWDYGGKSVFIGPEVGQADIIAKMESVYPGCGGWEGFIAEAARDEENPWVVQGLIDTPSQRVTVVESNGALRPMDAWLDRNAYAHLGQTVLHGPGVVRASGGRIVNILGGGGLVPVLRRSVFERLSA
jgi:hypothetical protein